MLRQSLHALASENASELAFSLQVWRDGLPQESQEKVDAFMNACSRAWKASINLKLHQLAFWLDQDIPYNTYRYHHLLHQRGDCPRVYHKDLAIPPGSTRIDWHSYLPYLKEKQAGYAERRRAFNEYAEEEEEFAYSAYHVQGKGAWDFGTNMVLIRQDAVREIDKHSFLSHDSLGEFVPDASVGVKVERLNASVAHADSVTTLMAIKHKADIISRSLEDLSQEICTDHVYLEGHLPGHWGWELVDKVVMLAPTPQELTMINDLAASGRLDADEDDLNKEERLARRTVKNREMLQAKNITIQYI